MKKNIIRIGTKILLSLTMIVLFIFLAVEVQAYGPLCSSEEYDDATTCDESACCYWDEIHSQCLAYADESSGNPDYFCTSDTVWCSGEDYNERYRGACDGSTAHCGKLIEICDIGENCYNDRCMVNPCGNGIVQEQYYEECDGTNLSGRTCVSFFDHILRMPFYGGTLGCYDYCRFDTSGCNHCGDGVVNDAEVCDSSESVSCTTADGYPGTRSCNSQCTALTECISTQRCGDGECVGAETVSSCFNDCMKGWRAEGEGFTLNEDGSVSGGVAGSILMSEGLEVLAGRTYNLRANLNGRFQIGFDSTCLSNTTFTQIDCDLDSWAAIYDGASTALDVQFTVPAATRHAINGIYYKNVTLRIVFLAPSTLANLSLREVSPVEYDEIPGEVAISGCCPADYCWNGKMCMNSSLWMDNASYEPVWNNVFRDNNWSLGHINTSSNVEAYGYRCVKSDVNGTAANWALSRIKYDWDFIKSGYCARETDCFVGKDVTGGTSRSCVSNGYIVDGNHYCHMGNWTTKSYIIATLLQEISEDRAYTLNCYNDPEMVYNVIPRFSNTKILSACVLTRPLDDQIITGIVLETDDSETVNTYIAGLAGTYQTSFDSDIEYPEISCTSTSAALEGDSNFSKCVTGSGDMELHVYYETRYKFLILSNREVNGIEDFTLIGQMWLNVKQFFRDLFGRSAILRGVVPYTSVNYTTSYDRIYVLRDEGVNVTAIEEYKFDEILGKPVTVFYIKHEGSSNQTNPINEMQIFKNVNRTVARNRLSLVNTQYIFTPTTQELIVRTDNTTGIWKYFTAILRTRPPGGYGESTAGANVGATVSGSSQHNVGEASNPIPGVDNSTVVNSTENSGEAQDEEGAPDDPDLWDLPELPSVPVVPLG